MGLSDHFPATIWTWRKLTGRTARRIYAWVVLLLLVVSTAIRIDSFILTRRISRVISGLSKLRIDETSEQEALLIVPGLAYTEMDRHVERSPERPDVYPGTERSGYVLISNESMWTRFLLFANHFSTVTFPDRGHVSSWILAIGNVLGLRYIGFAGRVIILDGKVSGIRYQIADDRFFSRRGVIIAVSSAHSYWAPWKRAIEVSSTDDESPQFHFGGDDRSLRVLFAFDAPPQLSSHAFQMDLACFWSLIRCNYARQVAPLLWKDRNRISEATLMRLKGNEPCPDRIVAGRLKYFPDLSVALLESTGFNGPGLRDGALESDKLASHYRLVQMLRGDFAWERFLESAVVPYPGDYRRTLPNNSLRWTKAGTRVLAFSGVDFDSCRLMAANPAVLSEIRNATTPVVRAEDELLVGGLQ